MLSNEDMRSKQGTLAVFQGRFRDLVNLSWNPNVIRAEKR